VSDVLLVLPSDEGRLVELRLNRPDSLNAISTELATNLGEACETLAQNDIVRAVVLSAAGERAFSAGADLKERAGFFLADFVEQRGVFRRAFTALRELPAPTIAAVFGHVLGGGLELALSCDVVVADESVEASLPEVGIGLVPGGGGTQLLPRRIGPGRASELILSGRRAGIDEAVALGMVDRRVPRGEARGAAFELAARIARNSPRATRAAKRAIRVAFENPGERGFAAEEVAWRELVASEDWREGIAAFLDKRDPKWPNLSS
jgi:enoyl-CoA hydratase/carnithine racemase